MMTDLILTPNLPDPDATYAQLIAAHEGLTQDESAAFNAKLILILVNHIGNPKILAQALEEASR